MAVIGMVKGLRLMAALVATGGLVAGCGGGTEPLEIRVDEIRSAVLGDGDNRFLAVSVTLENRGNRAAHLFYNGVRLVPEGADPVGYGEFIRDLGPVAAGDAGEQEMQEALAAREFDGDWVRMTARNERGVEPGEAVRERFGFRLDAPAGWASLELRYHDDASDRFVRVQRPVRIGPPGE